MRGVMKRGRARVWLLAVFARAGAPPAPAWVRAVDLFCLGLVVLAVVVALTGGFRFSLAGVRLSVTSPYQVLYWAIGIGLLRHVAAPAIPIYRDLPRRLADWKQSPVYSAFVVPDIVPPSSMTQQPGGSGSIGFLIRTFLLFTVLTGVMTYPQVWHMRDAVHDPGDPLLNLWALSWVAHQLPIAPARLFDANIFAPERWTLAYSETLLAPAVVATPLLWTGMSRIVVYNLVFVSGFILSGVGTALLVRDLTRNIGASIVAGVIFAYLPFRFDHYPQLQLQQAEWIPLALWAFHRVMGSGRLRDGLWLGAFVAGQVLSCVYYGIYLASYLVVVGGALMLSNVSLARSRVRALAAGVVLGIALLAPVGRAYLGAREAVGDRGTGEIVSRSATLSHYLATPASNKLYGWSAARFGAPERKLFPGLVALALAAVALWPPWSPVRGLYALGLGFAFNLTLGFNAPLYRFLYEHAPPYRALRIPALAVILVGFSLAVLAGFGIARMSARIQAPSARAGLALACCVAALVEGCSTPVHLTAIPEAPPAIYADLLRDIGDSPAATIIEVPMIIGGDQTYMYYSTFHWQTLLNGYSGFFPPSYLRLVAIMRGFPDARSLDALRVRGAGYAVIHGELLAPETYQRLIDEIAACRCGLTLVARRPWQGREISLYRLQLGTKGDRGLGTLGTRD
jgi:hypothetical protein